MSTPLSHLDGKYEIIAKLKEGGMGAVYKVRHRLLDQLRVIKIIRPQLQGDQSICDRFVREARTAVRLSHPNIAQCHDFAMDQDGNAFVVMEFIDGVTLEEMLARVGPPSIGMAIEFARQSLDAIGYLHRRGVVHRDIAPDNLMLTRTDDGKPAIKLIDLGIAKLLEEGSRSKLSEKGDLTSQGMFLGKVRYASPEQFQASADMPIDHRTDIYSMGIVMYELLTGAHPIQGNAVSSLIAGHIFRPPLDFAVTDPRGRIPGDLRALVLRALEKPPQRRPQSAEGLVRELTAIGTRFPWTTQEFGLVLAAAGAGGKDSESDIEKGSTQNKLNLQFRLTSTPSPTSREGEPKPLPPADHQDGRPSRSQPASQDGPASPQRSAPPGQKPDGHGSGAYVGHNGTAQLVFHPPTGPGPQAGRQVEDRPGAVGRSGATDSQAGEMAARLAEEVATVRRLLDEGRLEPAMVAFERLRGRFPHHSDVIRLQNEIASAKERIEGERRRAALEESVKAIETAVSRAELDRAADLLQNAQSRFGHEKKLVELRHRIEERRAAIRSEKLRTLVASAAAAMAADTPEHAMEAARSALSLEAGHAEAAALLRSAQERLAEKQRERERAERHDRLCAEIEQLLQQGELDLASQRLGAARLELGPSARLEELETAIQRAQHEAQVAQAALLVHEARAMADAKRFDEAIARIDLALAVSPNPGEIAFWARQIRADEEAWIDSQRRGKALADCAAAVEGMLRAGEIDNAWQALALGEQQVGARPELDRLREQVKAADAAHRRHRCEALCQEAAQLVQSERFEEAIPVLQQAQQVSPGVSPLLQELLEQASEGLQRKEAVLRLARAVASAADAVDKVLHAGSLAEARVLVLQAMSSLGPDPRLVELAHRIDVTEARQRKTQLSQARRQAAAHIKDGNPQEAVNVILEASSKGLADDTLTRLLEEAQHHLQLAQAASARQHRLADLGAAIRACVASRRFDEAAHLIDEAWRQEGQDPVLTELQQLIVEERELLRRRVEMVIRQARTSARRGDIPGARCRIEEELTHHDSSSAEAAALLAALPALPTPEPEPTMPVVDPAALSVEIRKVKRQLRDGGNLKEASRLLNDLVRRHGDQPQLLEMRARITELRRAAQQQKG